MSDGITSQYGFLLQRLAFIKTVLSNASMNIFFTYEGVDDIDIGNESSFEELALSTASNGSYIQVKSGKVSKDCWAKVVGNWILTDEYPKASFILFCEFPLEFDICDAKIIDSVCTYFKIGETRNRKSIARKVFDKLVVNHDKNELRNIIIDISQHCTVEVHSFSELKSNLIKLFANTYCADIKIYEKAKERRFYRFTEYVMSEIDSAIGNKKKYTLTFAKLINLVTKVQSEISDKKYIVDTTEIKKRKKRSAEKLMIDSSIREINQLRLVKDDPGFIVNELVKELIYKDFREVYADGDVEVSNMEDIAHTNYEDALFELGENTTPRELFTKTTGKTIKSSILLDSPIYRNGCYVFLTGEAIAPDKRISWGEDNG